MTGVVILNYNNCTDIINCVDSLFNYSPINSIKVVVVDNGSEPKNQEFVFEYLSRTFGQDIEAIGGHYDKRMNRSLKVMTYLTLPSNVGYACGNNAGIEFLLTDKSITEILVLNSDIIIVEDIISKLVSVLNANDKVAAVSPLLYKPDGSLEYCCARKALSKSDMLLTFSYLFENKYRTALQERHILRESPFLLNRDRVDIELPSGSCMMFKVETVKAIGGFDENTFLYYEEDILYEKIKRIGMHNMLVPSIKCIHVGGATTNKVKTAYFLKKCNFQSLIYYLDTYKKCSRLELLYVKFTAFLRISRLWLGMVYHKISVL